MSRKSRARDIWTDINKGTMRNGFLGMASLDSDTSLLISYYINDSNSASAQGLIHAVT